MATKTDILYGRHGNLRTTLAAVGGGFSGMLMIFAHVAIVVGNVIGLAGWAAISSYFAILLVGIAHGIDLAALPVASLLSGFMPLVGAVITVTVAIGSIPIGMWQAGRALEAHNERETRLVFVPVARDDDQV